MVRSRGLTIVVLTLVALGGAVGPQAVSAGAGTAATSAVPPIPPIPKIPKRLPAGGRTSCTMRGPAWVLYGVHTPNGPARHGNRYLVTAWGISCRKARQLLRAFFPKIPAHPMGTLTGGPSGYTCKGRDDPGTVTKSRGHDGSCKRLDPAAMFEWGPTGGKIG